jgi:rod shape-determining protein MreD
MKRPNWLSPRGHEYHNRWLIHLTLLVGLGIDSLSWSAPWGNAIPDVTPMILLYWVMALSNSNFFITAFLFGLFHDVIYHAGFGSYAMIYLLMVYPMLQVRLQLRNKTLLQMAWFIGLWLVLHQVLVWLMTPAKNGIGFDLSFWLAALMGMMLWPLLFISLRSLRRRAHIR